MQVTISMLQSGDELISSQGKVYRVIALLGSGGQGEVYEVESEGKHYALKWYHEHMATLRQREIIEKLVENGSPDIRFLWPMDRINGKRTFGYIMALRPNRYKSIVDLMKRKAEPSFWALCTAGYELADCFQKLHSLGYSYCDISFGNAFLDPERGEVLICDNDNVVVTGLSKSGVEGTLGFMAPEIVMGKTGPKAETDLYSLAILLFYMFMLHHPLEGAREADIKCFDAVAKQEIYGRTPLFIWDPQDKSNRPIAGYQENAIIYWNLYPKFIKDLFITAFTEGLHNPNRRIVENQWKRAFIRLRNSILQCPSCGVENFYRESDQIGAGNICWCCNKNINKPPSIQIGSTFVVLGKETELLAHHLYDNFDMQTVIAKVSQHPKDPTKWGLNNVTDKEWIWIKPDGTKSAVLPDKNAPLLKGSRIDFGGVEGQF
ncbi:serine/threonine protein kinase [Sporanaerobium hydrogeniformans]|uniref:Serine/threonine protein kinase n=1 Tax=Sporanaerobium hydrogeniformans TaxID=3072179 RepID=A0AC61DCQ0_9FIRM|nr:serine/threonine protein kinase [Sporanaerobium hydrogeniformans]PHV71010.1 serine/threonine protein kinase [Sporanaerobium hydrogeniformans]